MGRNADQLAKLLPASAELTEQVVSGQHGSADHFRPDDLAAFAAKCQ